MPHVPGTATVTVSVSTGTSLPKQDPATVPRKKRDLPGRNDSILSLRLPFSLVVCVSQKENKPKSHQEPSLPAALPDGSPACPAHERQELVS